MLVARVARGPAARRAAADRTSARSRSATLELDPAGYVGPTRRATSSTSTATEFRLLLELARRPGQVFTRELLLDVVWSYDYLGDSRHGRRRGGPAARRSSRTTRRTPAAHHDRARRRVPLRAAGADDAAPAPHAGLRARRRGRGGCARAAAPTSSSATRASPTRSNRAAAALRVDLRQAGAFPPPLTSADIRNILAAEESRGQHAIVVAGGRAAPVERRRSRPRSRARLRERVASRSDRLRARRRSRAARRRRGSRDRGALFLVVSEQALAARPAPISARVLGGGWLLVVLAAALVGRALAKRTLSPVARGRAGRARDRRRLAGARAWTSSATTSSAAGRQRSTTWPPRSRRRSRRCRVAQAREQRFTADVAHELRTPLTAMVAASSMLRERSTRSPAAERRPLELLVARRPAAAAPRRGAHEISRLDAGRADVRIEPLDLAELVRATLRARGWVRSRRRRRRAPLQV